MTLSQIRYAALNAAEQIAHALDRTHLRLGIQKLSKASRTTSERLRFNRFAERSSFAAKSAGSRIVSCRFI
jgi:hypothetical protein